MKRKHETTSAFIRSFPLDTPAKEIVTAGKAKGFKFTAGYVYAIRANDRKTVVKAVTAPTTPAPADGTTSDEKAFRKLSAYIGLRRAREILTDLAERAVS